MEGLVCLFCLFSSLAAWGQDKKPSRNPQVAAAVRCMTGLDSVYFGARSGGPGNPGLYTRDFQQYYVNGVFFRIVSIPLSGVYLEAVHEGGRSLFALNAEAQANVTIPKGTLPGINVPILLTVDASPELNYVHAYPPPDAREGQKDCYSLKPFRDKPQCVDRIVFEKADRAYPRVSAEDLDAYSRVIQDQVERVSGPFLRSLIGKDQTRALEALKACASLGNADVKQAAQKQLKNFTETAARPGKPSRFDDPENGTGLRPAPDSSAIPK